MLRSLHSPSPRRTQGFTLVEIAIAIGILAVALVALMGMLPAGMSNFRKAMDTSVTAQIAQKLLQDMEEAEFDEVIDVTNLPKDPGDPTSYCKPHFSFRAPTVNAPTKSSPGQTKVRFFTDQGVEVFPPSPVPNAYPDLSSPVNADAARLVVYHVNVRIIPRAELPTINETGSQVAQITIQVARNPGVRKIPFVAGQPDDDNTPERNLFQKTTGVSIFTYHALLGKNQGK